MSLFTPKDNGKLKYTVYIITGYVHLLENQVNDEPMNPNHLCSSIYHPLCHILVIIIKIK